MRKDTKQGNKLLNGVRVCGFSRLRGIIFAGAAGLLLAVGTAGSFSTVYAGEMMIGVGPASGSSAGTKSGVKASEETTNEPANGVSNETASGTVNETSNETAEKSAQEIAKEESWSLILVNRNNPIPDDYVIPELTELANENSIDSRVYPQLQKMFDDARSQGIYPHINSSYRTHEKQVSLMEEKVNEYLNAGYSEEEANKQAQDWVAIPGTSEHELGLSLDISTADANTQDAGTVWWWLKEYCSDYGFILRYPEDKTEITGISNEPWHFRYVGVHAAKIIMSEGLCLEEYLEIYG